MDCAHSNVEPMYKGWLVCKDCGEFVTQEAETQASAPMQSVPAHAMDDDTYQHATSYRGKK